MNQRMFGGFGALAAACLMVGIAPIAPSQAEAGEGRRRNAGKTSRRVGPPLQVQHERSDTLTKMLRRKAPRRSW